MPNHVKDYFRCIQRFTNTLVSHLKCVRIRKNINSEKAEGKNMNSEHSENCI